MGEDVKGPGEHREEKDLGCESFRVDEQGCDGGATVEDKTKPGGAGGPASFEQTWDACKGCRKQHQKAKCMQCCISTELLTRRVSTDKGGQKNSQEE